MLLPFDPEPDYAYFQREDRKSTSQGRRRIVVSNRVHQGFRQEITILRTFYTSFTAFIQVIKCKEAEEA